MKIVVVANPDVALGFRLAGVKEVYEDKGVFEPLLSREDVAVVFFQKKFLAGLESRMTNKIHKSIQPAFIQIEEGENNVQNLIRSVLGVEVN